MLADASARAGNARAIGNSDRSKSAEKAFKKLRKHLRQFVNLWNVCVETFDTGTAFVDISPNYLLLEIDNGTLRSITDKNSDEILDLIARGVTAPGYALFEDKIRVVQQTLYLLDHGSSPLTMIKAPSQWGKTITLVMTALLRSLQTSRKVVLVNTNRNAVFAATNDDLNVASRILYGALRFRKGKVSISGGSDVEIVKRYRKSQIESLIKNFERRGVELFIDEGDEGTQAMDEVKPNGVLAHWMSRLEEAGTKYRLLTVSATPYEYDNIESAERVEICPTSDSGYAGLVHGRQIPIVNLEQFTKIALGSVDERPENKARLLVDLIGVACRGLAAQNLKVSGDVSLVNGLPCNGGRAIMIRASAHNADTESLLADTRVKRAIKKFKLHVVRAYGVGLNDDTEIITNALKEVPNKVLLIFVTGSFRRANRVPSEVTIYIDLTRKYSTAPAAEQGLIGRATGYNKIADGRSVLVMVSEENYDMVRAKRREFMKSGNDLPFGPVPRTITIEGGEQRRSRPRSVFDFYFDEFRASPEASGLIAKLEKFFSGLVTKTTSKLSFANKNDPRRYTALFDLLGEADTRVLETLISERLNAPVQLLRPGQFQNFAKANSAPKSLLVSQIGSQEIYIATRDLGNGHSGANLAKTGFQRRQNVNGQIIRDKVQVIVGFREIEGEMLPAMISLHLCDNVSGLPVSVGETLEASPSSAYFRFQTPDKRDLISAVQIERGSKRRLKLAA